MATLAGFLIVIVLHIQAVGGSTTLQPASDVCKTCRVNQYCPLNTPACFDCHISCTNCTSYGENHCLQCKLGYRNVSGTCGLCPPNTFGPDCASTCRCLNPQDPAECDPANGHCASSQCAQGWQGVPTCQTPCSEGSFGSGCVQACHCPPGDTCSPVNGLCSSGACAIGWASTGCQNELPQLDNPPDAVDVSCANVTVTWLGWRSGVDRGETTATIKRYELYSTYRPVEHYEPWKFVASVTHNKTAGSYQINLTNLVPDVDYKFRVDVIQEAPGGKDMPAMTGKNSTPVFILCTETTTTSTTPEPTTTTKKPPDSNLLDDSKIRYQVFRNNISGRHEITVTWGLRDAVNNETRVIVTLTLSRVKYAGIDCALFENGTAVIRRDLAREGTQLITEGVTPWTEYSLNISASNSTLNISDFRTYSLTTLEDVPSPLGKVENVRVVDVTKTGGVIQWSPLNCSLRHGSLRQYRVYVFNMMTSLQLVLNDTSITRFTSTTGDIFIYQTNALKPYTKYGINVVFENSLGAGPNMSNLTEFTTAEGVPGPPSIEKITEAATSITVTVRVPDVTNGVLTLLSVRVFKRNETGSVSRSQSFQSGVTSYTFTVPGLEPLTEYFIEATASTRAGAGNTTNVQSLTTLKSVPLASTNVTSDVDVRNETCLKLTWQNADDSVTSYNVSYEEKGVLSETKNTLQTNNTSALVCNLKPGTFYDFTIVAWSTAGYGEPVILTFSTEQPDPPRPKVPEVLNTTASTITVALEPEVMTSTAYAYGYLLAIDDVTARPARATSNSNSTCPGINEIPGKIIRNFTQSELLRRTVFVIGDKTYEREPYTNGALTENHLYSIYFIITIYFRDICKYNYSNTLNPIKAETVLPIIAPKEVLATSNLNWIIPIIVLVIILVAIIITIIICLVLRRRQAGPKFDPFINEADDFNLKVYRFDDYDPHKFWNKIYSLRESRFITAGREYLPVDNHPNINSSVVIASDGAPITFHDEFANLPHGLTQACEIAERRENRTKNRFSHLIPYDQTRVILDPDPDSSSTYINANFVKGYRHQHEYIAAQSPFDDETVLDFWRMVYQYEVQVIVMMSHIVEDNIVKCTQYWPEHGRVRYGSFLLECVDVQEYASYVIRQLRIKREGDEDWQIVYQFEATYWPEHGVPDDPIPLIEMRRKVSLYQNKNETPVVVHCGTGVSRSGVFIAVDSLMSQYADEGRISVFSFVRKMRNNRTCMVRTVKQYLFIYETIFEAMHAGDTWTGPDDLKERYHLLTMKNPSNGHSYLHGQFKSLSLFTRKLFQTSCSIAFLPVNFNTNRYIEIVPPDVHRPVLTTPGRSDYINAVFLDSHRKTGHFVITQTPLHTTVIDFWRLVYDLEIYTIVMMEPMMHEDDTCAEYWPEDHMKQFEPFFVETVDVYQQENITIRNLKLTYMNDVSNRRHIRQFQFNAWSDSEFVPKSKSMLLDVIDLVNDWQTVNNNDTTPILVHCKDGATHGGLFIAVSVLCEKVQDESEVDVLHTVKHLKRRRNQIVDTLDQFRFCYKALWDFINMRMPGGTLTDQMSRTKFDRPFNSLSLTSYQSVAEHMPY
ncbi:receptor-type tyrosine-protein phosphatase S-like isoform X2 [Dreissena polymorpha]|nr:receptor-type tyrosine-protein phosphatase S-like isoform X2 [Dreissena polymorpha]XP_052220704.1 receptor-type tyrosine-protein phosphatase S-like isoform X2 [Dreissena polymorpha]